MKTKLILIAILFTCKIMPGQVIVSSCTAPDSIVKMYKDDADRLTVRRINAIQATYKDSIKIPKTWSDTVLKALIAVYNATTLPARNTVIGLNIHTFQSPILNSIDVSADSNLFWMHQLRNNIIPTGFSSLDSLLSEFNLQVVYYHDYSHLMSYHTVSFQSDSNYNISPLTTKFDSLNNVMFANPPSIIGDGNDIKDSILPTYVKLIYSYGWQDCPSGCMFRHFWEFKIYYDCSVEFVGEYGSPYSTTNIENGQDAHISIYPNPTSDQFLIEAYTADKLIVDLYDVNGRHVLSKIVSDKSNIDVTSLNEGIYSLTIKTADLIINKKLVILR